MRRRCVLALILVPAVGLIVVVAQQQVSMRASAPPPVQSQSVRYGGRGLLPSEQRNIRWRSGLLPSEWRDARWSSGALPSQGRIAAPPGASVSLRYPTYNHYYRRTANSLTSNTTPYFRTYQNQSATIRYHNYTPQVRSSPRSVGHTFSYRQSFNTYRQVAKPNPYLKAYRPPTIRYRY